MKWTKHYTGIEYAERQFGPVNLYLSRYPDKFPYLTRLSWRKWPWKHHAHLGLIRSHYIDLFAYSVVWEIWTNNLKVGWITLRNKRVKIERICWTGSQVNPFHQCYVRLGRLTFSFRSPKWVIKLKRRQEERFWEEQAEYEENDKY